MLRKLLFLLTLLNILLLPVANVVQWSVAEEQSASSHHKEHKMTAYRDSSSCYCPQGCCKTTCTHCACTLQLSTIASQIHIPRSYQSIPCDAYTEIDFISDTLPPELPPPLV